MTNIELIDKAKWIATIPTIYVTGGQGQPMYFANRQRFLIKDINENQKDNIRRADSGVFAFDCNGLVKAIMWGFNANADSYMGGAKYVPSEDIPEDVWITKCNPKTDFSKIVPGAMVWMPGHMGIYIGGGYVIESTPKWEGGVQYSVCANHPEDAKGYSRMWTKWGCFPNIQYIKEDKEVKKELKILVNGEIKTVSAIENDGENYPRLRDLDEKLGLCKVDYDSVKQMPIVETR